MDTLVIFSSVCRYDWLQVLAWRRKYKLKGDFPLPLVGNMFSVLLKVRNYLLLTFFKFNTSLGNCQCNQWEKIQKRDDRKFPLANHSSQVFNS